MKAFNLQLLTVISLSVFWNIAAVHADESDSVRDLDLNGSDCISIRLIRDYKPLDSRSLLIYGPAKSAYFVRLAHPSTDLKRSFQVRFASRDDRLCPYGGDRLVFGNGFVNEEVSIRAISRISKDQAEQILYRFGEGEPDEQNNPVREVTIGTEVEEQD